MMRISLWQQFSSNHSAQFTVVGVFQNPLAAKEAAKALSDVIDDIAAWHEEHPQEWEEVMRVVGPPTEVELKIAKRYGMEWGKYALDWPENGKQQVKVFDRLVFLDSGESAFGAYPMDGLVSRLGGQPFVDGSFNPDDSGQIQVTINCQAPDKETATILVELIKPYIYGGQVRSDGLELHGENLVFADLPYELPKVLTRLRDNDCQDIEVGLTDSGED